MSDEFNERYERPLSEFELQQRVEVFGADRLAQLEGNEATPEDAERLTNAVKTLCKESSYEHHGRFSRSIMRKDGNELILMFNPEGVTGFGDGEIDYAQASLQYLKVEKAQKPKNYLMPGKFEAAESMYVDDDGMVRIRKYVYYAGAIKSRRKPTLAATKDATTQEVDEALDILTSAVREEDRSRSFVNKTQKPK